MNKDHDFPALFILCVLLIIFVFFILPYSTEHGEKVKREREREVIHKVTILPCAASEPFNAQP